MPFGIVGLEVSYCARSIGASLSFPLEEVAHLVGGAAGPGNGALGLEDAGEPTF